VTGALQVIQELQQGPNSHTILQADALKFVTIFRAQLPKPALLEIFPHVVALLKSDSNVVHSYAAILIERLLASKVSQASTLLCAGE
jgi:exportin-2 (importin alpha re-exporter)